MAGNAIGTAVQIALPVILDKLMRADVPVHNNNAPEVAAAAAEAVAPMMVNKANAEPWYQSRVTWGAIGSISTGVLALLGIVLTPEDVALIVTIGTSAGAVLGGLVTLYGRWKAKKPIGQ